MTALTRLDNGVSILSHQLPGRRTAAIGVWIARGSRDDAPNQAGCAHLLEHLVFHGLGRGAGAAECPGGPVNAATSRELTLFHGVTTAAQLTALASSLSGLLLRPAIDAAALRVERAAVLHEIAGASHGDALPDELLARVWPEHPLARPIAGDPATARSLTLPLLRAAAGAALRGPHITVVATGAVDHDELVAACLPLGALPAAPSPRPRAAPAFQAVERHRRVAADRSHLIWVMPVAPFGAGDGTIELAEAVVAGPNGRGRLPGLLRDRLGLVYGVESRLELYSDAGLWWLRLECDPWQTAACRAAVESAFHELVLTGPGGDEIRQSLAGLRARRTLEDDDPEALMERIAREWIALGRVRSAGERGSILAGADPESLRMLIRTAWKRRALFTVGPHAGAARGLCA